MFYLLIQPPKRSLIVDMTYIIILFGVLLDSFHWFQFCLDATIMYCAILTGNENGYYVFIRLQKIMMTRVISIW